MPLNQALLPEFDHEMANTRRTLERIPEDKFTWRPHAKSQTMGKLAVHLAMIPMWAGETIARESIDVGNAPPLTEPNSRAELLASFDKNVSVGRAAIAGVSDEDLKKPWSLVAGGKTIFTMPRIAVLRSFVMSHAIHHRAQLGVYLRLIDVPVPAIYGPSADEKTF